MNIAVIAAQGKSGQAFVKAALIAGHHVRAGVKGESLFAAHPELEIVQCDATHADEVATLIGGSDAVVSLIGHVKGSARRLQTEVITTIASAMQNAGVERLVSLTGTGARVKGDTPSFIDRILNIAVKQVDPDRVNDGIDHINVLESSRLDWTVIRVLKLTRKENPGTFRLSPGGPAKLLTPRTEVAQAILQVLEQGTFIRALPVITSGK